MQRSCDIDWREGDGALPDGWLQSADDATAQNPIVDGQRPAAIRGRRQRLELLSVDDVLALSDPEWLIEGMVEVGAQGVVYGPSGEGKTFVVLDWALSIATGRSWKGRAVKKGPVVYVVTEGGRGIRKRIEAWRQEAGVQEIEQAFFVLEAVQLKTDEDYRTLVRRIEARNLKPALIVLDTFARCFVGGDENTSKDVGEFMDASRRLQQELDSAILLVHHTGKDGKDERGSSALRAAADVMFKVSQDSHGLIRVENDRQKDDEETAIEPLELKQVTLQRLDTQRFLTSCVLRATDAAPLDCQARGETAGLNQPTRRALEALSGLGRPATSGDWRSAISESMPEKPLKTRTYQNWREALVKNGYVELDSETKAYRLTAKGAEACHGTDVSATEENSIASACHATTPTGWHGGARMAHQETGAPRGNAPDRGHHDAPRRTCRFPGSGRYPSLAEPTTLLCDLQQADSGPTSKRLLF